MNDDIGASNVVQAVFDMAITNDSSEGVVKVLCSHPGLSSSQYYRLYETADTDAYKHERGSMLGSLARNPSLPMELLMEFATSADIKVAALTIYNDSLPTHALTNILNRLTYSDSVRLQSEAARHPETPPNLLRHLATTKDQWGESRRVSVARHPNCPADLLAEFGSGKDRWLRKAVAEHPSTPLATLKMLVSDGDPMVRNAAEQHPSLPPWALEAMRAADGNISGNGAEKQQEHGTPSKPDAPPQLPPRVSATLLSPGQSATSEIHSVLSPALKQGLVLHYAFNTNEIDTVTDVSGHGRTANAVGVLWVADAPRGGAIRFGSKGCTIWANDKGLPSGDAPRTIAAWMRIDEKCSDGITAMFEYGDLCALGLDWRANRDRVSFSPGGRCFLAKRELPEPGTWFHVAYTYAGNGEHHLYIDGVREDGMSELREKHLNTTLSGCLRLGGHAKAPGPDGHYLDEVMIYSRALSADAVHELYRWGMSPRASAAETATEPKSPAILANATESPVERPQTATSSLNVTRPPDLMQGLVLHYSFDSNETGVVSDLSGRGRTAHASGVKWIADGPRGGAVRFGSNRCTIWTDDKGLPSGNAPRTIAMWMRLDEKMPSGMTAMFSYGKNGDGQLCALNCGRRNNRRCISFSKGGQSNFSAKQEMPEAGTWFHVVYVYDSNSMHSLYLDGKQADWLIRTRGKRLNTTSSGLLLLGGHPNSPGPDGRYLDEVMIFDRALTDKEVLALFLRGSKAAAPQDH